MSPIAVNAAKRSPFTRLPGELPIYRLPRGNFVLYYAPGYLAAVAAGEIEEYFSSLVENDGEDPEGKQVTPGENGTSPLNQVPGLVVIRSLINAARTAIQSRISTGKSPFQPLSLTLYLNHCCNSPEMVTINSHRHSKRKLLRVFE